MYDFSTGAGKIQDDSRTFVLLESKEVLQKNTEADLRKLQIAKGGTICATK